MELKTPVRKGFRTPHYRPPLPIISEHSPGITVGEFDWPLFNGHYNGISVIVDDTAAIFALTKKGFFGKGSLSRGCPNLSKRKFPYNVLYESQWKRRKQWIKSLNDLLKSKDASTSGSRQKVKINNQPDSKVSSVVENLTDDIQKKSNPNEKEEKCTKNIEENSLGEKREECVTISEESYANDLVKNLLVTANLGNQVKQLFVSDKSTGQNIPPNTEEAKNESIRDNGTNQILKNVKLKEGTSDDSQNTKIVGLSAESDIGDNLNCGNKKMNYSSSHSSGKSTPNINEVLLNADTTNLSKTNKNVKERESLETKNRDNSKNTEAVNKMDMAYKSDLSTQNTNEIFIIADIETSKTNENHLEFVDQVIQDVEAMEENLVMECSDNFKNTETVDLTAETINSNSSECVNKTGSSSNFKNTETVIRDSCELVNEIDKFYNPNKSTQNVKEILVITDIETSKTNKECVDHVTQNTEARASMEVESSDHSKNAETIDLTAINNNSEYNKMVTENNTEMENSSDNFKNTETVDLTAESIIIDCSEHLNKMDESYNSSISAQNPNETLIAPAVETPKTYKDHFECDDKVTENVNPTENLELEICDDSKITKKVDLNTESITLNPNEVLVIADMEADLEQYFKNLQPHIEEEKIKTVIEVLYLSLEEAFFLSFACNCLQVFDLSSNILGNQDMWVLFQNSQADFIEKYVAYHYFRAKGWVVKSGTKFGSDFLLYKKGPLFFHASYIVIVEVIKNGQNVKNNMCWEKVNGINRMADSATKDVILCHVFWPTVEKEKFNDPSVLKEFGVCETLLRKWQATQEKTAPVE